MERAKRTVSHRVLSPVIVVVAVMFGSATSASAAPPIPVDPANGCGQVLGVAGEYVLEGDLVCSGAVSGLLISSSNVILHLAGYTISNPTCDLNVTFAGVYVSSSGVSGVQIDGGTIVGFNDGIILFASSSIVKGVTVADACTFGIAVAGQDNRIETNLVTGNHIDGIGLGQATRTSISSNDISGNGRLGVGISNASNDNVVQDNVMNDNGALQGGAVAVFSGTNNTIRRNAANGNVNGIAIDSPGNLVLDNTVNGSGQTGIAISAIGNASVVRRNTVLGSGVADLSDGTAACGGNVWRNNTFKTDLVQGSSNGGPGAGCIR